MKSLKELQEEWNTFGKVNPQWAILNKKGENVSLTEFFKFGQEEISNVMNYLNSKEISINKKGRALDFGCGMGRLTQALAPHFKKVYGIDISSSMIKLANKYNKSPRKVEYILNDKDNLSIFKDNTFDFIYTNIVLQHIPKKYIFSYIKEFIRILKPNGILLFQLPSKRLMSWQTIIEIIFPKFVVDFAKKKINGAVMDMNIIRKEKVTQFLKSHNVEIIDIAKNESAGRRFESFRYCVTK